MTWSCGKKMRMRTLHHEVFLRNSNLMNEPTVSTHSVQISNSDITKIFTENSSKYYCYYQTHQLRKFNQTF